MHTHTHTITHISPSYPSFLQSHSNPFVMSILLAVPKLPFSSFSKLIYYLSTYHFISIVSSPCHAFLSKNLHSLSPRFSGSRTDVILSQRTSLITSIIVDTLYSTLFLGLCLSSTDDL